MTACAEAYVARGRLQFFHDWDWAGAENSIRRAFELDPNNLDAHFHYSLFTGGWAASPKRLLRFKWPNNWTRSLTRFKYNFGRVLLHAGRLDEALRRLKQAIEREPRSYQCTRPSGGGCTRRWAGIPRQSETYDKARVLRGHPPDDPSFRSQSVARVYALMGKSSRGQRMLKGLEAISRADEPALTPLSATRMKLSVCFSMWWRSARRQRFHCHRSPVRQPSFRSALERTASPDELSGGVEPASDLAVAPVQGRHPGG